MNMLKWLIWSEEHRAWWGPNHNGYVKNRKDAGRYEYTEALKIVKGANIGLHNIPNEAMIQEASEERDPSQV